MKERVRLPEKTCVGHFFSFVPSTAGSNWPNLVLLTVSHWGCGKHADCKRCLSFHVWFHPSAVAFEKCEAHTIRAKRFLNVYIWQNHYIHKHSNMHHTDSQCTVQKYKSAEELQVSQDICLQRSSQRCRIVLKTCELFCDATGFTNLRCCTSTQTLGNGQPSVWEDLYYWDYI